jgi:hypothetical protein
MSEEDAILSALREVGLPDGYRAEVASRLRDADPGWRACCGGFCDPCALTLARAVDRARALLGSLPGTADR